MPAYFRKSILTLFIALSLSSCGGGGGGNNNTGAPVPDQAIGGAWVGTDGNGDQILALSTESGQLHWVIPATGEQGFGTATVQGNNATATYMYVAPLGSTLADGSTAASCTATGTIQERQSISLNTNCSTNTGGSFSNSASLTYDQLYELDSSLSVIAGNYDDFGVVINVAANGVIFEQDPNTGCIINGQASVIDSRYNTYNLSFTYSSCLGAFTVLNGSTFSGLAIYDNTVAPAQITVGVTGNVGGIVYSQVITVPKI